jgi:hypothetical protein
VRVDPFATDPNVGDTSNSTPTPRVLGDPPPMNAHVSNIVEDRHPRPPGPEHITPISIRLTKKGVPEPSTSQPQIQAPNTTEK